MHTPVMTDEIIRLLGVREPGVYVDGTVGAGGHAAALLKALGPGARLIGIDRDPSALARAEEILKPWESRCVLVRGNYADMRDVCAAMQVDRVDGILLDIGVSSMQIDEPERGFSFMREGPLDMRMDPDLPVSAADLIAQSDEDELIAILRDYGEEPQARRIARALAGLGSGRTLRTTRELADLVERVTGGRRGGQHPATRTFQALRIAVNGELDHLEAGLESGLQLLGEGGRMAVLSYHSLEDRRVKDVFSAHVGRDVSLQAGGSRWEGRQPSVRWVQKKPLMASTDEVDQNPRARSAKLRVIERMEVERGE